MFEPINKRENKRGMTVLQGASVPIDLADETASAKGIETVLPEVFKQYIQEIISVTIGGKEYDSTTTFTEAIKKGGFITLKVKMPVENKSNL